MSSFATNASVRRASRKRAFSWRGGAAARFLAGAAIVGASPLVLGQSAQAGTDIWVGSTSVNWSVLNGFNTIPVSGDSLAFGVAGAAGTTLNDDLTSSAFNIAGITFNAGASTYIIGGNAFALTGAVVNNSSVTETVNDAIALNGTQTFSASTAQLVFGGVISGTNPTDGVITNGAQRISFNVANTYTGITTIASGDLVAGVAGSLGVGGNITFTGGTLDFGTGTDYSARIHNSTGAISINTFGHSPLFASALDSSNTGGLSLIGGPGALYTTAANAYTGTTTLGVGTTLVLGGFSSSATGSLNPASAIVDNGTLNIVRSNTVLQGTDFSGAAITGTGGLTQNGSGTTTLTATNTFTGATMITSGGLQLGNAGTTGSLSPSSAITDNTRLTINRTNATVQGTDFGTITGTGQLVQAGSGTTTLTAANTYTGQTTINAGSLQLGNGGTTGSLSTTGTIFINNGGNLTINRSNAATQGTDFSSAAIAGNSRGSFTQAGTGTTTLNALNTFGGGVTIAAGILNAAIADNGGGALGATYGAITFTGGTLQYGGTNTTDYSYSSGGGGASRFTGSTSAIAIDTNGNNVTFGTAILGTNTGGLTKLGTGTLTLTAANAYTGTTTVSAGTLALNKAAADSSGALTVTGGTVSTGVTGALGGGAVTLTNGTVKNTLLASGGTANDVQTSSNLSLGTGNSVATIDFGLSNAGAKFVFTNANASTFNGVLDIINYTGNPFTYPNAAAPLGLDQLFFAAPAGGVEQQLTNVFFINPSGQTGTFQGRLLASGEVVAPEPSQYAALLIGALGLGGLALKARRRSVQAA